ncbi:QacE family quaternary ammonium compound efflux SMR transporter [Paludibacter sp. 221]|uniref:DMT family transporter n=1 Tax=Paludibacter sp. 221 TaxID=2302939 RepID=UPI0013D4EA61|nr:multidrug efflux SMR transporter [Paludibacter sp. 221]NDV47249.1 QacE family quaternary ammonium compound efflux SMR transporter [Paludibacter sp. 221]
MNWIYLLLAGCFEVGFTFCIGKTKESVAPVSYYWYVGFLISLAFGMWLLIKATQTLPIGTSYAIFTGIGAVGTVLVGIFVFNEPATFMRMFFITTLILSIIGLKIASH